MLRSRRTRTTGSVAGHRIRWAAPAFAAALGALCLSPGDVAAHGGAPPAPHEAWRAWNIDPVIVVGLAVTGWLYARGAGEIRRRAGNNRGVKRWHMACFWSGFAGLAIALVTPLDPLGEALFSFHMVQHLMLTLVAAPLLVLGGALPWLWALPAHFRPRFIRLSRRGAIQRPLAFLLHPVGATTLNAAALWAWHTPKLYGAALNHAGLHALEHLSFLGSGLLFWWAVIHNRTLREWRYPVAFLAVFATAVQSGALGALLTFSGKTWYSAHEVGAAAWGITPLEDQQIAGTLMWVPPGLVYLGAALALLAAWLGDSEAQDRRPAAAAGLADREGWASR